MSANTVKLPRITAQSGAPLVAALLSQSGHIVFSVVKIVDGAWMALEQKGGGFRVVAIELHYTDGVATRIILKEQHCPTNWAQANAYYRHAIAQQQAAMGIVYHSREYHLQPAREREMACN